ncbi:zinc-dependent metalloprotease, partial [Flavobacteriales bacterium]|nr:zinc-dependent metalloprotease [Flavobacteriales bacterium]
TATHEIGHYFGLMHTFCEEVDNQGNPTCCDNDDNIWGGFVDDTPAAKDIYFGSVTTSTNNNTCNDLSYSNVFNTNVKDMDENFMSYAANTWMFSQGQIDVMLNTLNTSDMNGGRNTLKNATANSGVTINCNGSVDVNEYQLSNIHIYPNPTLGKLNITSGDKINMISLLNVIGETVFLTENLTTNSIDISSLEGGIYFLNISTDKGTYTEKIILTK